MSGLNYELVGLVVDLPYKKVCDGITCDIWNHIDDQLSNEVSDQVREQVFAVVWYQTND
jgi:hypothetical protein